MEMDLIKFRVDKRNKNNGTSFLKRIFLSRNLIKFSEREIEKAPVVLNVEFAFGAAIFSLSSRRRRRDRQAANKIIKIPGVI